MTTMHINIEESVAEAIRQKAQRAGKTPEALLADAATQFAAAPDEPHWVDRFLEIADKAGGDSKGQKWTREDIYDR